MIRKYNQFIKENNSSNTREERIDIAEQLYGCFQDLELEFPEYKYGYSIGYMNKKDTLINIELEFKSDVGQINTMIDGSNIKSDSKIYYGFFIKFKRKRDQIRKELKNRDVLVDEIYFGYESAIDDGFIPLRSFKDKEELRIYLIERTENNVAYLFYTK